MSGRFKVTDDRSLTVEEALAELDARAVPVCAVEEVATGDALGRVLAVDVVSAINVPQHDNSAMDGWAFAHGHRPADGRFVVVGRAAAGHPFTGPIGSGQAIRILTGAPAPVGVDTVAMQEDCQAGDGWVVVPDHVRPGANLRPAGEDVAAGAVALTAGTRLRPQELGLASAIGLTRLSVYAPLKVAVFSTGDEVNEPGSPLPPGGIYDSNRTFVLASLRALGASVRDLGILADRTDVIAAALAEAAASHDVVITTGGVSEGDEDHVKAAICAHGSLHFWRLAIKPGRPVALGEVGGAAFIGLPGNPVATAVTFLMLARPLLLRLMGATATRPATYPVAAGFAYKHRPGRREWLRARVHLVDGRLVAEKYPVESSGVLSSMVWSDGLVAIPEACQSIQPGDSLVFLPYAELQR